MFLLQSSLQCLTAKFRTVISVSNSPDNKQTAQQQHGAGTRQTLPDLDAAEPVTYCHISLGTFTTKG